MAEIEKLYKVLSQDPKYNVGTEEEFVQKFSDSTRLKKLYDVVSSDNKYKTGEWDAFYNKFGVKKKDEVSSISSDQPLASPSTGDPIEEQFPFLKSEQDLPIAEPSTTRVEPPVMEKDIVDTSPTAKKFGLPPSEKEFTVTPEYEAPAKTMLQKWTEQKYKDTPGLEDAIANMRYNESAYKQAGSELRNGLTTPTGTAYQKIAEKSEFARTALGMLRGVNEGVANTLKTLDGAERAFYDAIPGFEGQGDGWFGRAADYINRSLEENWPEVDRDMIVGKLTYDIGHLTPFFGELMLTPKIGKIGQLENLLTTKGFAAAYGDADIRKELGEDVSPLKEGLYGATMGAKDAMMFKLLGYGSGRLGEEAAKLTRSGDVGVFLNMLSSGLGFTGYGALDQYIQIGEVDASLLSSDFFLGVGLSSPGMMQYLSNRALNNYYGTSSINVEKARRMPINVIEARDMAYTLRERARKADGVNEKMRLFSQAKVFDAVADIKAMQLIVVKDPEGTIRSIKENESLTDQQKKDMIQRVQEETLNVEVDKLQKEGEKKPIQGETKPSEGKTPPKGESTEKQAKKPPISKEDVDAENEKFKALLREYSAEETTPERRAELDKEMADMYYAEGEMITREEKKAKTEAKKAEAEKAPLAESVKSFSVSEKPENVKRGILEPPEKPPKGEGEKEKPDEREPKQKLFDMLEHREAAEKALEKKERKSFGRKWIENVEDVSQPLRAAIKKEGGDEAQRFINRFNQEAGASPAAKVAIQDARERVFGKRSEIMSQEKQAFVSEIANLMRTAELDDIMAKRREEILPERIKEEKGKVGRKLNKEEIKNLEENVRLEVEKEFADKKHEENISGEEAKALLKMFWDKDPEILSKYKIKDFDPERIKAAVEEYHKVNQEQLTKRYENRLINKAAYEKLSIEQPHYSRRAYIDHWESLDPGGSLSGIKPLGEGSYGPKVVDMYTLMSDNIARTERLVARNRKMVAASDYAATIGSDIIKNAPFSKEFKEKIEGKEEGAPYLEPQFVDTPKDRVAVDFLRDGKKSRLWIDKEMYEYFDYNRGDPDAALDMISTALGVPMIKLFATGANPEFAVKNLLIDALHAWLTTDVYSPIMPIAWGQMGLDYLKTVGDAWGKGRRWKSAMDEGLGMNFLTTQGLRNARLHGKYTKQGQLARDVRDSMAKMGEFSEVWTRLALREREINKAIKALGRKPTAEELKEIQRDATATARNYLDFSQGGALVKKLDKFVPYLNAGVQVTRGSVRAARNNPVKYGAKLLQLAMLAHGLTHWNTGADKDDEESIGRRNAYMNDITPSVKARNFIIMSNWRYKDHNGNTRYLYWKIPKDAFQNSLTAAVEDVYIMRNIDPDHLPLLNEKGKYALKNEFRNVPDIANMPPTIKIGLGWLLNKDLFYGTDVWTGKEVDPFKREGEYYDYVTPERYIKLGEVTGISPVRANHAAKQLFTANNIWASAMGEVIDGFSVGFKGNWDNIKSREIAENLQRSPFARRVLKATYPQPTKETETAQKDINRLQLRNDHEYTRIVGGRDIKDIDDEELNAFLAKVYTEDGGSEADRIMNRLSYKLKGEGISPEVIHLVIDAHHPHARAIGMYALIKKNPDKRMDYINQARNAGIASEEFFKKLAELMDQENQEE